RTFDGLIDELRIHTRALSESEIADLMGSPVGSEPGGGSDTTPPSVPSNVVATAVSATEIGVSWSASTDNVGVTGYDVFRDGVLRATVGTTTFSDTGLSPSTTYAYTVRARDAAGNVSSLSS